jgi:hypothetical protein
MERKLSWLLRANLALGVFSMLAPGTHVLETPNKLLLDADLWLAVQQHLYRGWGPFLGGPAEVSSLAASIVLAYVRRKNNAVLWAALIACIGYAGMLTAFFALNSPVTAAVSSWKSTTLPSNWTSYRLRWEVGHAIAALLSVISLAALIWAYTKEQQSKRSPA